MVWPFKTRAFVGRRGRTGATGRRAQSQRISIESLESRIALSVANDSDPLAGLPVVVSPPVRVQAVVVVGPAKAGVGATVGGGSRAGK